MKKKEMSQDMDWQDFVEQLRKIGLELVTDVVWAEIPFYSCGVQAGLPNEPGDFAGETVTVPREWADCGYVVNVHGESMLDYDFREGDRLLVRSQKTAESGDIVIASVDGGMTVKAYYEDERGEKWLVPGNAKFNPIALSHYPNCCIMGRVMEVTHLDVRARMSDCVKRVNRWRGVSEDTKEDSAPVDVRDIAANEVLADRIKGRFYGKSAAAREFVVKARGMKNKEVVALVAQYVNGQRINREYCRKDLWEPLNEAGIYTASLQNWCRQLNGLI